MEMNHRTAGRSGLSVIERPLYTAKCKAWCATSAHGIIDPLLFEEQDKTVTTIQERYRRILGLFYALLQGQHRWFQQDGVTRTPHRKRGHEGA